MIPFQILALSEDIIGKDLTAINLILKSILEERKEILKEIMIVILYLEKMKKVRVLKISYVVRALGWEWQWLEIQLELISQFQLNFSTSQ